VRDSSRDARAVHLTRSAARCRLDVQMSQLNGCGQTEDICAKGSTPLMTFAVAPLSRENREALSSPREGAIIFRDLVGKLGVRATSMCGRRGYHLDRLIERGGIDGKL
jgi:hypothetical protein